MGPVAQPIPDRQTPLNGLAIARKTRSVVCNLIANQFAGVLSGISHVTSERGFMPDWAALIAGNNPDRAVQTAIRKGRP